MLISRVIFWNQILAVARRIDKQDDYTKYMLSIIAIVMRLFSKVSTYPELGQIRNWPKKLYMLEEALKISDYLFEPILLKAYYPLSV